MSRLAIAAAFGLIATAVNGQALIEDFYTVQTCAPRMQMVIEATALGEQPLFEGTGVQFHYTEESVVGGMVFFVNQETGSWSLINFYADGMACLAASGEGFRPYVVE